MTEKRGTFGYTRVNGDFVATCRVTAASAKSVGAGLRVGTGTEFEARFLKNAFNRVRFGHGPAVTIRQTDNVASWQPGDITQVQPLPCWLRLMRYRDSLASYYSADGQEWNLMQIGAMCMQPEAKPLLRVTGQNKVLDSSVCHLEGNLLHIYQLANGGGQAIACDGAFMFETTGGGPAKGNRLDRFPVALDRIGAAGPGVSQTKSALAGTVITGVGVRDGKVYLAMVPRIGWNGGTLLRQYDPTGTKVLWERQGLEFQKAADGDPGTDGVDVFTQTH